MAKTRLNEGGLAIHGGVCKPPAPRPPPWSHLNRGSARRVTGPQAHLPPRTAQSKAPLSRQAPPITAD